MPTTPTNRATTKAKGRKKVPLVPIADRRVRRFARGDRVDSLQRQIDSMDQQAERLRRTAQALAELVIDAAWFG